MNEEEKNAMVPSLSVHFGRITTECFVYCVLFIIKKKHTNRNRNLPNIILHVLVCCHCHLYAHKLEHFTLSTLGVCFFRSHDGILCVLNVQYLLFIGNGKHSVLLRRLFAIRPVILMDLQILIHGINASKCKWFLFICKFSPLLYFFFLVHPFQLFHSFIPTFAFVTRSDLWC